MKKAILTSILGNVVEWYDFALIAYLSPVLAKVIFVESDPIVALLSTLLIYALGFLIRPLGAIAFGHIGDRLGRSVTLKLSISLVALATLFMALVPSYQAIGIASPLIFAGLRIIQGLALGGEFAGTMVYLTEISPVNRRAFVSSMTNNGSNIGVLCATLTSTLFVNYASEQFMLTWGWRLAFALGGGIGLLGLYFRNYLTETETFLAMPKIEKSPLQHVLRHNSKEILQISLLLAMSAAGSYLLMGYISTYLHTFLGYSLADALKIQTYFILTTFIFVPLFGLLSDKLGRKPLLYFAGIAYLLISIPSFQLLEVQHSWLLLIPLVIAYSAEQSTTPVAMVEHFPIQGRYTGVSLAYNVSMAIIGGLAPYICTYLIYKTGNHMMLAYLIMATAIISLFSTPFLRSFKHC